MFLTRKHLSRRTFLKGAGVSLGLPLLDAMIPAGTALAQTAAARKLRVGFFYLPHGAIMYNTKFGAQMDRWTPSGEGAEFTLNTITKPLEPYKKYVTSLGNLKNDLVGSTQHVRNPGTWLSDGGKGATLDQIIADQIGPGTPYRSLELASETTTQQAAGNGTALSSTVSFRDADTPLKMEYNPKLAFLRLFKNDLASTKKDAAEEASLLDLFNQQIGALQRDLGPSDRAILDSHLTAVREAEQRVAKRMESRTDTNITLPRVPEGPFDNFDEQVRFMFDLIALAFRADMTRVVSFMMAAEGTNQTYNHIGVPDSFHPVSHHADDPERIQKLVRIQTWHVSVFAEFLGKLAAIREGEGTLLDNAMFLYGSNMSNSSRHNSHPLPTLLIGGGAGRLPTAGRHVELPDPTPIANLHRTLLGKVGLERKTFGDSTGTISL
ncbi:MAG TPA: DUF1552 domain-containing protein [Terriglobia bacterium]|nr:DUF1552 domain-containing protein [Terriglobia bacterium]